MLFSSLILHVASVVSQLIFKLRYHNLGPNLSFQATFDIRPFIHCEFMLNDLAMECFKEWCDMQLTFAFYGQKMSVDSIDKLTSWVWFWLFSGSSNTYRFALLVVDCCCRGSFDCYFNVIYIIKTAMTMRINIRYILDMIWYTTNYNYTHDGDTYKK